MSQDYAVFASVVTYRASKAYLKNPKLHIITGKLIDTMEIKNFIQKNNINYVVDATHPFALNISENLINACKESQKPLLRFERKLESQIRDDITFIPHLTGIENVEVRNKNILLAIGSRLLNKTAEYYIKRGANVFTRIIPTPESVSRAIGSCIPNSNIAILQPSKNRENSLEKQLCDFWQIDYLICRDSGGYSQINWKNIILEREIKMFLVERPKLEYKNSFLFSSYDKLVEYIKNN